MTFLEAVNAVLRRLREDEVVSTNSTDYSKLIGDFVNQSINEIERAWDWNVLQKTTTINTVAGDNSYDFSNADARILSAINTTKNWYLRLIRTDDDWQRKTFSGMITGSPYAYSFRNIVSGYKQIILEPQPDAVEVIKLLIIEPTVEYSLDGTNDSEEIKVPSLPIVLNAYAKAVSERGEDGGIGVSKAEIDATTSLSDAISRDSALNHPSEVDWHAV